MEVASLQQPSATEPVAEPSMDIDMDIDLGPLPEPDLIETDDVQQPQPQPPVLQEGAVDPHTAEAQHEKVHIRGVDDLATDDIVRFASEHFTAEQPSRIEWIDDTSANIVYSSEEVGLQALAAMTQLGEEDASPLPPLRLRTAKSLSSHLESVLQVRSAVKTDRKKPRAHESSRFYLMHPEHDPREKLRRDLAEKRRRHDGDGDGDYRRLRFDDREHRRRRDRVADDDFNVNMYDDAPSGNDRRGTSVDSQNRSRPRRNRRAPRELFPSEGSGSGRLRDRSASPGRDDLDDMRRSDDESQQTRRRFRERSPRGSRANATKELFPSSGDGESRELFPNKTAASYLKKELLPHKTNSNHRRTDAIDAADETADLFSKGMNVPLVDGSAENDTGELYIKGAANDQGKALRGLANGVSIKGNSQAVKELFPNKYNSNAGKELFSDKLEGRGGRRRRAEDMFS